MSDEDRQGGSSEEAKFKGESSKGKGLAKDGDYGDEGFIQELMERKIPVLPHFPENRQLQGQASYGIWRVLIESVLETHDLLPMVSTPFPRPKVSEEELSPYSGSLCLMKSATRKEANQWDRLNARIRSFIFLNCTPSVIEHIKNMTGAREIWLRLGSLYNRMTPMKRVGIEVQMRTLKPSQSALLQDHINKLQAMQ